MTSDQHLILKEITLRPSEEWTPQANGWMVGRLAEGGGYWLHDDMARELNVGDARQDCGPWRRAARSKVNPDRRHLCRG